MCVKRTYFFALCFAAYQTLSMGCKLEKDTLPVYVEDVHSFSRPNDVVVKHLDLDLEVNFEQKRLTGGVKLTIDNRTGTEELWLDTRDLTINRVTLDDDSTETTYTLGEPVEYLGRSIVVKITPHTKTVHIAYETSPQAAALQWLEPEQTAGGRTPFLFTQSQAILARTWIPCQDSPGLRITYTATIRTSPDLLAVMSAENSTQKSADGVYHFTMPQAIPSYLLALAVGDLQFRSLGERSGVYAEPQIVDKAAAEFEDTEKMMAAAEKLYGPYRWGRYDIIVLPPSFPFGGMENPRLTFATPTVLAGDKSLVALIAHELAHSWSGNLVTNANWDDFWLNEGFTTYFEHRIMEELYGKEYADMLASLSHRDLQEAVRTLGEESADTHLHLSLKGRDPDEGMTAVAYDKGHFFLRTVEQTVGRERWDTFLRTYFDKFAFQSMTTENFQSYLQKELLKGDRQLEEKLQLEAWLYGAGIPDNIAAVHSDAFAKVEAEVQKWQSGTAAKSLATDGWTTHHWLHFLHTLPDNLSKSQMRDLDAAFGFSTTGNSEVLHAWLLNVVANQYAAAYPALEKFLTSMGRRKFLKPLYEKMAENPALLEMAKLIYQKARPTYHAISVGTIDDILNWRS
ncbi:MAG: M1 family metallopeptidase [bacterium]